MFYARSQLVKVLAVVLGLVLLVTGCMIPIKQSNTVRSNDIFNNVLPITKGHLEDQNYMAAYRSILMEQNQYRPTSLEEVMKVSEIRSRVAKIALNKALADLRRHYYSDRPDSFELAKMSASDANFICEMERLIRPRFLTTMNLRLELVRQERKQYLRELYLIYPDDYWGGIGI